MPKRKPNPDLAELIGRYSQNDVIAEMEREYSTLQARYLSLSLIDDNHVLKEISFPPEVTDALGKSLKEKGFFSPLVVRPMGNHYELVLGRKRFMGAKEANFQTVPCVVKELGEEEMLLTLVADVRDQRDGNVVEMAFIFQELQQRFGYSQATLGKVAHLSRSQVTNILRLLHLPNEVLQEVMDGTLTYGHARAIASLSDEEIGEAVAQIHRNHLSVRETEALAKHWQNHSKPLSYEGLKQSFGAEGVVVGHCSVTLHFASEEEKERFLASYSNKKVSQS